MLQLKVVRTEGSSGDVEVQYQLLGYGTALFGIDYEFDEGHLKFRHGAVEASLDINVLPTARLEEDLTFSIELLRPNVFGAKLGRISVCTVTLTEDETFKQIVNTYANVAQEQENIEII